MVYNLTNKDSLRKHQRHDGSEPQHSKVKARPSKHILEIMPSKHIMDNKPSRHFMDNKPSKLHMNMAQSIMDMHNQADRSRLDIHRAGLANTQSGTRLVRKDSYMKSCITLPHINPTNASGSSSRQVHVARRSVSCEDDEASPTHAHHQQPFHEQYQQQQYRGRSSVSPVGVEVVNETSLCSLSRYPTLPYINDGRNAISPSIQVKHLMGLEADLQQRALLNPKQTLALAHNARDHSGKNTKLPPIDFVQAQEEEQRARKASQRAAKRGDSPELKRIKTERSKGRMEEEKCAAQCSRELLPGPERRRRKPRKK